MIDLTGRVVLITGAAGNLGRAVAERAEFAGAYLVLVDRHVDALAGVASGAAEILRLPGIDLARQSEADRAVAEAGDRFGRLDALVCTVGAFASGGIAAEDWDAWERMLQLNLRCTLTICRAAAQRLTSPGGRIVTLGARPALAASAGMAAYAASKAGVLRLTESLAAELGPRGITANAVMPSIIDTPQNRAAMPDADPRHWVTPAALADVIMFLISDMSRAVSGAAIPAYGLG